MGHYLSEMESPEPIYKMKDVCYKCGSWTKNPKDGHYKCYCGDCPAKQREISNGPVVPTPQRVRILKEIEMLEKLIKKLKKQLKYLDM